MSTSTSISNVKTFTVKGFQFPISNKINLRPRYFVLFVEMLQKYGTLEKAIHAKIIASSRPKFTKEEVEKRIKMDVNWMRSQMKIPVELKDNKIVVLKKSKK